MKYNITFGYYAKTLLVVNHDRAKLKTNSSVLATFNRHDLVAEEADVLSWVQQHQPDLIILNLEWAQLVKRQLIAALRLDWLTRNIPIMVILDPTASKLNSTEELNCDACLVEPYSTADLDRNIRSLVPVSACELYGKAV